MASTCAPTKCSKICLKSMTQNEKMTPKRCHDRPLFPHLALWGEHIAHIGSKTCLGEATVGSKTSPRDSFWSHLMCHLVPISAYFSMFPSIAPHHLPIPLFTKNLPAGFEARTHQPPFCLQRSFVPPGPLRKLRVAPQTTRWTQGPQGPQRPNTQGPPLGPTGESGGRSLPVFQRVRDCEIPRILKPKKQRAGT